MSLEKKGNKCKTCWGYGLWAVGFPCPMGPMDFGDGMPNKICPECGAGRKEESKFRYATDGQHYLVMPSYMIKGQIGRMVSKKIFSQSRLINRKIKALKKALKTLNKKQERLIKEHKEGSNEIIAACVEVDNLKKDKSGRS